MKTLENLKSELMAAGFLFERPARPRLGDRWIASPLMSLETQYSNCFVEGMHSFYYIECVFEGPAGLFTDFNFEVKNISVKL